MSMEANLPSSLPPADVHPLGSLENPIRVKGISGEYHYLQRLFTSSARSPLFFHRLGSITRGDHDPVDIYELIAQDNSGRWVLAISPYFQTASEEAPEGLLLGPQGPFWGNTIGVNSWIEDFPIGLCKVWKDENPAKSGFVEYLLSQFTPAEWRNQPCQKILAPMPRAATMP